MTMIQQGAYFHLEAPPVISAGPYQVTNAASLPADLFIRDFSGEYLKLGSVGAGQTTTLPPLQAGQLLFSSISPEMYTLTTTHKHIVLHTVYAVPNNSGVTIAGFDGPDSLIVHNHFVFPISIEFDACPSPLSCRRYCDGSTHWATRRYDVNGMHDDSLEAPSIFISAMDGALRPETELRIFRKGDHQLIYKFRVDDPRIQPPWAFGDIRLMRELEVGVPSA